MYKGEFQFTHPGRGATKIDIRINSGGGVSIHAPREGCDILKASATLLTLLFQFTHPGRGATLLTYHLYYKVSVSIHAPREGCDKCPRVYV